MNWQQAQIVMLDGSAALVQFAVNWLLQSALLIALGLLAARLMASRGSAAQSAIYRTALAAVLVCPLASLGLSLWGVSGWSLVMPRPWTLEDVEPVPVAAAEANPQPALPAVADSPAPLPMPGAFEQPNRPMPSSEPSSFKEMAGADAQRDAVAQPPVATEPVAVPAAEPAATTLFSVAAFGWLALGLAAVWLLVSSWLLVRLGLAWWQLARLRRAAAPACEATRQICRSVAAELGVAAPPVLRSPFLPSPCLTGLRQPVVLLPETDLSLSLRDVLIHELAHLLRRDCQWSLLRHLALSLFFFQPLLWKLSRRLETAAEEVCDDYVVSLGGDRNQYAHRLVDIAELATAPLASAGVGIVSLRSILAQRVRRIMDTSRTLSTRVGNALLVLVVVGGLTGTVIVGLVGVDAQAPAAQAAGETDKNGDPTSEPVAVADDMDDDTPITIRGRVIDAAGKPLAGATVRLLRQRFNSEMPYKPLSEMTSDAAGNFEISYRKSQIQGDITRAEQWKFVTVSASKPGYGPGWIWINQVPQSEPAELRLPIDDLAITGRLVDLEGRPLAGIKIECGTLQGPAQDDLTAWVQAVKRGEETAWQFLRFPLISEGTGLAAELITDADGRFRLTGVGRERTVELIFQGPSVARTQITAVTRSMPSTAQTIDPSANGAKVLVVGADFEIPLPPTRVIEGVVRDAKTGAALAGVGVKSWRFANSRRDGDRSIRTVSDAQGRFRLVGMPKGAGNRIVAIPNDEQPYLMRTVDVPDQPGLEPAKVDFQLDRGIWITGRVTDRATGRPVSGAGLHYLPFRSNEYARALPEFPPDVVGNVDGTHHIQNRYQTAADGTYRLVGLPGPAIVGLSDGSDSYFVGQGASEIRGEQDAQGNFATFRNPELPNDHYWPTAMKQINPAQGADLADVDFALEPGGQVEIAMVDPAGQPIAGVAVQGKTPHGGTPPVGTATFAATGFKPTEERTILLRHLKRGLGKAILVRPEDQRKKIAVRLEPFAKVTGRLVDQDQKPITGRTVVFYTRPRMGIPLANEISDAQGRFEAKAATGLSFTAMVQGIPGSPTIIDEMSAEPGETIDLGTIDISSDKRPEPVRTKAAVAEAVPNPNATADADDDRITIPGRVLDPAGKPIEGATVRVVRWYWNPGTDHKPLSETKSDREGHFEIGFRKSQASVEDLDGWKRIIVSAFRPGFGPAWIWYPDLAEGRQAELRLATDDLPITGRLVDLEARPLAGVNVHLDELTRPEESDLSPWLDAIRRGASQENASSHVVKPVTAEGAGLDAEIVTDADGRFRLTGIGRERLIELVFTGPSVARTSARVLTRPMPPLLMRESNLPGSDRKTPLVGADFQFSLPPTRVIQGIVRDAKTGQPLAGVGVQSRKFAGRDVIGVRERDLRTVSDAQGHFRLVGMPKGAGNEIIVVPTDQQPYLMRVVQVPDPTGLEPVRLDAALHRGIWITGRVIDQATGEPVRFARVHYLPFLSNEYAQALPEFEEGGNDAVNGYEDRYETAADGSYRLVGLPGRAIVGVAELNGAYVGGQGSDDIQGLDRQGRFPAGRIPLRPGKKWPTAMKEINPADTADSLQLDFALDPGRQVEITVLDPAGQPLPGVTVTGMTSDSGHQTADGPTFVARSLGRAEERTILLHDAKHGLGKVIRLRGEDGNNQITVRLAPCPKIVGRLVDSNEVPITSADIDFRLLPEGDFGRSLERTTTDANGRFEQRGVLPDANYAVFVQGPQIGFKSVAQDVSVEPGETIDLGTIDVTGDKRPEPVRTKAAAGAVAVPEANAKAAADDPPITIPGRVLDPTGKPVAGATVRLLRAYWDPAIAHQPLAETTSGGDGRFQIAYRKAQFNVDVKRPEQWKEVHVAAFKQGFGPDRARVKDQPSPEIELHLATDDVPITGRLVDLEGRPLPGVRIECNSLLIPRGHDLSAWLEAFAQGQTYFSAYGKMRGHMPLEGTGLAAELITDSDGRFRLTGVGHERAVELVLAGPSVALTSITAVTRPMSPLTPLKVAKGASHEKVSVMGADFQLAVAPTRAIEGVVRDAATGQPLAGVGVQSWHFSGADFTGTFERKLRVVSDEQGRFQLVGMPKGPGNRIIAIPNDDQPFLMREADVPDEPGLGPARVDFELHRGIWITGRVTDAETGQPVPMAEMYYMPFKSNEFARALPEFPPGPFGKVHGIYYYQDRYQTAADGTYRLVGLPGPAIVGLKTPGENYRMGQGAAEIHAETDKRHEFMTFMSPRIAGDRWPTAMKEINPAKTMVVAGLDFALERGAQGENTTVDASGQPLDDATVIQMTPQGGQRQTVISGKVTSPDDQPVAGAHVAVIAIRGLPERGGDLKPYGQTLAAGTTDGSGNYRLTLSGVSSKTHREAKVIARQEGFAIAWQAVNLDAEAVDASLKLAGQEPIRGRLVDIEGQPAAGVRLVVQSVREGSSSAGQLVEALKLVAGGSPAPPKELWYDSDETNLPAAWIGPITSDAAGRFAVPGIPAGWGLVLRTNPDERFAPQDLMLNTGATAQRRESDRTYRALIKNGLSGEELVLPLAPAQWFEGQVTYADSGQPAPRARLTVWASQQEFGNMVSVGAQADGEGRYRVNPRPGIQFGVNVHPADGTPYLACKTPEPIAWLAGTRTKRLDLKLPRGVLVQGVIIEKGTGNPVAAATVQYVPEDANNPNASDSILTGWQGIQLSDEQGKFAIAVLPGPGRLLVHGPQGRYVFRQVSGEELSRGKPGGRRNYAHAIERIDPALDAERIELSIALEPSARVFGAMVDDRGGKIDAALVISRLQISPLSTTWRGMTDPTLGGNFELTGLVANEECPVYFLDAKRRLGATQVLRADGKPATVVLQPCGRATARLVDPQGNPHAGVSPLIQMVVTPGAEQFDYRSAREGKFSADEDFIGNIDRTNYPMSPKTDRQGRITLPVLIPGASYRFLQSKDGGLVSAKEFSVTPNQQLDLGDVELDLGL